MGPASFRQNLEECDGYDPFLLYGIRSEETPKVVDERFFRESVRDIRATYGNSLGSHFFLCGSGTVHLREQKFCRGNGTLDGCRSSPAQNASMQSFSYNEYHIDFSSIRLCIMGHSLPGTFRDGG